MQVEFLDSYDRSVLTLPDLDQRRVARSVRNVLNAIQTGKRSQGLGLRRLRGNIWECRAGLKVRVLFELKLDRITFVLAGSHDDIRRYLR